MNKQTPFTPVDSSKKLAQTEEEILKFWEENKIFEKSLENRKTNDDSNGYSFYDGPPFATGLPHYGHIVGTILKDVIPRYWTMKGKYIPRKWGWDCHGLPIENIVEKELGSKTKKEIEELGVDKFNELCRSKVLEYASEWEKIIPRLGRWVDMKNAYRTMDLNYMESVWWVFKQLWDKDLIYYNYRSMHICPRCETTLSQSEVSEGYKDVKDLSVIAKFKLEAGQKLSIDMSDFELENDIVNIGDDVYILAWTTTPWTLPGNVALAINPDVQYVKMKLDGHEGEYIFAVDLYEKITGKPQENLNLPKKLSEMEIPPVNSLFTMRGSDLVGLKYKPLWDTYAGDKNLENKENGWKVQSADFITTEDGTGVVHIAPAFGEDDMNLGKEKNLPFIQHVGMDGVVDEKVEAIGGLNVKPIDNPQATDIEVIKYLAGKGLLFHKEKYEHSYPHCWRCDTPLINYATGSWFVAVTKIKKQLLENAKDISWTPEHIKNGRFGKWLEGGRDWSISRQRFWASVMPIWVCDKCEEKKVFGSVTDLEKISGEKIDDLHKHTVDKITFECSECGGTMKRVPDVLDTWFDSGSMPYGQGHYPFENKENFEKTFPADFIAEGIDQTRAWFYYLHIIAGGIFDKQVFKNVIVNGIVLAEDGQKMSKKLQNYPDPMEMVNKYGADPLRFYLAQSPVVNAQDLNFSEKDLAEVARGTFRMLWQSYSFFVMYANIDGWSTENVEQQGGRSSRRSGAERSDGRGATASLRSNNACPQSLNILDKWLISELHQLIKDVNAEMEEYHLMQATRKFAPFIDNLSNWYIRRSRKRFWKSENDDDKNQAYATLHYVLIELSKLLAPFAPFISDEIYRNLATNYELYENTNGGSNGNVISVHLEDFPIVNQKFIDENLNQQMQAVREIIQTALQLRAKAGIKVRQPLNELKVESRKLKVSDELIEIIKEELNVKKVIVVDKLVAFDTLKLDENKEIGLDIEITPELKMEGQAREAIRCIQQMRKEADYQLDDRIEICYSGMSEVFDKFGDLIAKETLANKIEPLQINSDQKFDLKKEVKIDGEKLEIAIKK